MRIGEGGGLNREGGLINFSPLKRGGLFERGSLIEDLRYITIAWLPLSCDQAFLIQGKRDRERESFSLYLLKQKGNKNRLIAG